MGVVELVFWLGLVGMFCSCVEIGKMSRVCVCVCEEGIKINEMKLI